MSWKWSEALRCSYLIFSSEFLLITYWSLTIKIRLCYHKYYKISHFKFKEKKTMLYIETIFSSVKYKNNNCANFEYIIQSRQ